MRPCSAFLRLVLAALAAGLPGLAGQDGLQPPVPLAGPASPAAEGEGGAVLTLGAARRAQDLGLPSVAADLFRRLLDQPGADRDAVGLALATALIDAGRAEEALRALEDIRGTRGAAWQLRVALAEAQRRRVEAARAAAARVREAELPPADLPWWWFVQGELADLARAGDFARANEFYRKAEEGAPNELARSRFQLAAESLRLRLGPPREADLKTLRENHERHQGTALGHGFAQTYAVALDALGQKGPAVSFLQGVLIALPRAERVWWDKLHLVLGLIGDKTRAGAGRNALVRLLESGHDPLRQRQALQILAAESAAEPERGQFRALLTRLIDQRPEHPVREGLLFFRAQLGLLERELAAAEEDANELLRRFPLSPLRVHAYGVLTQSAWEQRRFRLAADYAQKARAALGAGVVAGGGTFLAVLEAEAWFRAGLAGGDRTDFRSAAEAYAAVLRARPADLTPDRLGGLMLLRVLAEIRSGSGAAGRVLDELAADPAFDAASRWRAEWSLVRSLQLQETAGAREAYARVNRLLAGPAPAAGLPPDLRARMAWLQARLSFDAGEPARTLELVDALTAAPSGLPAGLQAELSSSAALLRARAEFALGREPAALETLRALRAGHPGSDAAASSFLTEAEHFADQDKIDEARNRLVSLTDNPAYRTSPYVPYALFRLATLAERLGRPENLQEANKRLEELVASPAATGQADLIFAARLRQGNLFRKLNDFPAAQRAYEDLVNRYPRRPDVVLAQLALADTHSAQSSAADSPHADAAQLLFEQLRDRVDAPRDVRVEAGHKLGLQLARKGRVEEAIVVWWRDVVDPHLRAETGVFEPGATRPYWLARTLRELGEALERLGRLDEARRAYQLLLDQRLPVGEAVARSRLEQLGTGPGR